MQNDTPEKLRPLIEQILAQNLKLINSDIVSADNIAEDEEKLQIILKGLNSISDDLELKSLYIESRTDRLNELLEVLLKYTLMDFSQQLEIGDKGDELDAIALGLNTLGEELESHINQLKEKSEDLIRSNKQLEQFVYIASHDLQEPLKTLSNYVSLFQETYNHNLNEKSAHYLQVINKATVRMRMLIRDLLEYARVGQDGNEIAINCDLLVNEVLADMAATVKESEAEIKLKKLPVINGNYNEIKSLFQNLISNAIKFKNKNEPVSIHINVYENVEMWTFAVEDNGIGIEAQYLDRIFSIFQKLHAPKEYEGTGIGLAHCKKIVEAHRGLIWAESIYGQGTTIYFTIPKNKDK